MCWGRYYSSPLLLYNVPEQNRFNFTLLKSNFGVLLSQYDHSTKSQPIPLDFLAAIHPFPVYPSHINPTDICHP